MSGALNLTRFEGNRIETPPAGGLVQVHCMKSLARKRSERNNLRKDGIAALLSVARNDDVRRFGGFGLVAFLGPVC